MYIRGRTPDQNLALALPPGAERRMSRAQRLATQHVLAALNDVGITRPDAIFSATALGCLADTEQFLDEITSGSDVLRSPVPFMRSTHNTIAGQIALHLRITGPNITFSQDTHGFHAALLAGLMFLEEGSGTEALLLAWDEHTEQTAHLVRAASEDAQAVLGEGFAALVLGSTPHVNDQAMVSHIMQWHAMDDASWEQFLPLNLQAHTIEHFIWAGSPRDTRPPIAPPNAVAEAVDSATEIHGARAGQMLVAVAGRMHNGDIDGPTLLLDVFGDQRAAIVLQPCSHTA